MINSPEEVRVLVERELSAVKNPIIAHAIAALLVPPEPQMRGWDYGAPEEQFLCWTVAKDQKSCSGIAYCEGGFGPMSPWGLVGLSDTRIGMDCEWFGSLAEAFLDSFMAGDLPVWSVVEWPTSGEERIIASGLTSDAAFAVRDRLGARWAGGRREVAYRPDATGEA